ncbi:hypothetical protein [Carnobacterium maltaromaticum]
MKLFWSKYKYGLLLIIFIFIALPIVIGLFFLNQSPLDNVRGSDGDWIGFWGSYIGSVVSTLVAAGIAYFVSNEQIKKQSEEDKKLRIEEIKIKLNLEFVFDISQEFDEVIKYNKKIYKLHRCILKYVKVIDKLYKNQNDENPDHANFFTSEKVNADRYTDELFNFNGNYGKKIAEKLLEIKLDVDEKVQYIIDYKMILVDNIDLLKEDIEKYKKEIDEIALQSGAIGNKITSCCDSVILENSKISIEDYEAIKSCETNANIAVAKAKEIEKNSKKLLKQSITNMLSA